MRRLRPSLLSVAVSVFLPAVAALAFDLPDRLPTRAEGLWTIERTESVVRSGPGATFESQKVWRICLDAKSDRALHELEVREQQAQIAGLGGTCEAPRLERSGNVLSWTMRCTGVSPAGGGDVASEVRHATTFVSDTRTSTETVVANRAGSTARSGGRFLARMERVGPCEAGMRPGDMVLAHWRIGGEETLKARRRSTVAGEITARKAEITARLER